MMPSSSRRCSRGGSFVYDPQNAQSGRRDDFEPSDRYGDLGLRPARTSRL